MNELSILTEEVELCGNIFQDMCNYFKINESNFILIPAGQTCFVQPLDVGVNKVFKDSIY